MQILYSCCVWCTVVASEWLPRLQGWIWLAIVHRVVSSETRTSVLYDIYTVFFIYNYLQLSSCVSDRNLSVDLHPSPNAC